jgi:hypothetical protein
MGVGGLSAGAGVIDGRFVGHEGLRKRPCDLAGSFSDHSRGVLKERFGQLDDERGR